MNPSTIFTPTIEYENETNNGSLQVKKVYNGQREFPSFLNLGDKEKTILKLWDTPFSIPEKLHVLQGSQSQGGGGIL